LDIVKNIIVKIKILSQYSPFSTGQAVLLDYKELHGLNFKRIEKIIIGMKVL